jgi:uncharacterized protein YukE
VSTRILVIGFPLGFVGSGWFHYNIFFKGGGEMPISKNPGIRIRTITVHPPEAEAIARAFGDSRLAVESDLVALEKTRQMLEADWQGNQQVRFVNELRSLIERLRNSLIPQLQQLEKKYSGYTAEKTIEEPP